MSRNALVYDRWFQIADQDRDGRSAAPISRRHAWRGPCMATHHRRTSPSLSPCVSARPRGTLTQMGDLANCMAGALPPCHPTLSGIMRILVPGSPQGHREGCQQHAFVPSALSPPPRRITYLISRCSVQHHVLPCTGSTQGHWDGCCGVL